MVASSVLPYGMLQPIHQLQLDCMQMVESESRSDLKSRLVASVSRVVCSSTNIVSAAICCDVKKENGRFVGEERVPLVAGS